MKSHLSFKPIFRFIAVLSLFVAVLLPGKAFGACNILLTSGLATNAQTVCVNSAITNITYTISGTVAGFSCTGLPTGVTCSASSPYTISGTPTVPGTYTYTISATNNGGCTQTGTITVGPIIRLTSAIGSNIQTRCISTAITPITYTIAGGPTGVTYTNLPPGCSGSAGSPYTISGTPTTAGTYNYTVTTSGGSCGTVNATGSITVIATPTISLSSSAGSNNQSICQNTGSPSPTITFATGGGATGATVAGLPAGMTGSWAANVFSITGTPTAAAGSYPYTVSTTGMAPCSAVTSTGTITVTAGPTISLSSAAGTNAQTRCISTAITNITYATGGSATGASLTAGAFPTGVTGSWAANVYTITGTPSVAGVFNYTITTSGGSCGTLSLSGSITVLAATSTSTNGGAQTLAACATSTTLTGNTPTSGTGSWTVSPAGPTFSPNANTPDATANGMVPGTNYTFTWTIANAPCASSASSLVVTTVVGPGCNTYCTPSMTPGSITYGQITNVTLNTINNATAAANVGYQNFFPGTTTNVISGSTYTLTVSGTAIWNGTGANPLRPSCIMAYFDFNGDGDMTDSGEAIQVGDYTATSGTQTASTSVTIPAGAFPSANLEFTVINAEGPCPISSNPCPTLSTNGQAESYAFFVLPCNMNSPAAGPNQSLASCVTTATFAGNVITNGTGSWSLVSGAGNITNPASETSTVTNLGPGVNTFTWTGTPTVSGCPVLSSTVTITTLNVPTNANAGIDQGGCASSYTMAATSPTNGTGAWACTSGCTGVTITTPSSPTTTVTGVPVGTTVLTWTVTGSPCSSVTSTDQMSISVAAGVTAANAGPDQTSVCWNAANSGVATLSGNAPTVGTGTWTVVGANTTGGTLNNANSPNATITGINASGSVTLQWTITGAGCASSSSDQVTITSANCNGDEPCTAIGLAVTSGTCSLSNFDNTGLTISTGMPEPGCATINGPDMWFSVTVPQSGQVQINSSTAGTFDELISIYDGTCGNLQFSGCVSGSGSNVYPLTYAGAPGSTIFVRVNEGGTGDASLGAFQICAYEATTSTVSQVLPGVTTTITCGQTLNFYDTGGAGGTSTTSATQPPPAGNYTNNTGTTWKICPSDPTQYVSINFSQFLLENGFDKMIITSGTNNVIAQWTSNQGAGDVVTSQAPGECLTIYFQSDYSYTALGWAATVTCTSAPTASQISNECVIQNCTGGCGKWICMDGTYSTVAGAGSGVDEISEVTGGCWGAAGEVATSWFYFTTSSAGSLAFEFSPSNSGHNINFALYGPTTNGVPPCPTITGDAPIRCSFASAGGLNTGLATTETDLYDIATGNGMAAPLTVAAGQTFALVLDVYQNGQPPTSTTIDFTGTNTNNCSLLPIDLLTFDGMNQGRTNVLNWIVASQTINDYFTIEKSVNGTFWEVVGIVDGAGTTQTPMFYTLEDESPYFPITYYRLKQTDFDGKFKYSDLIAISNNKNTDVEFIGHLFPNPTSDFATFLYNGTDINTPLNVTIVNQLGEKVQNLNHVNLHKNIALTLRTNEMAEGLYQVIFTQGDQRQVQKLSIVR